MNPIRNPFAPGAGSPPPALVGRHEVRETVRVALERLKIGRAARSVLMVGLRGVGKTVLLDRMRVDADAGDAISIRMEVPESRSLPALLAPHLRMTLLRLSRTEQAKDSAIRGLRALAGMARHLRVKFKDIEVGIDYDAEPGLADNGDLESDLTTLLEQVGLAAHNARTLVVLFIDELQYVEESQMAALISALHRCAQRQLPVTLVGAGLPSLRGRMGDAKTYAERLFSFVDITPLSETDAKLAIAQPAADEGVTVTDAALDYIYAQTQGYPYFIQEWGKHVWDVAAASPIGVEDAATASREAVAALDESFFRVRFDRLSVMEKTYLRAMAELGPGPHASGAIAKVLRRPVSALGATRGQLIAKGMIWSPAYGDTAFTVPLFDAFMRRIVTPEQWQASLRGRLS